MRRTLRHCLVPVLVLLIAGCEDAAGPALDQGNVDVQLDATVVRTDTSVIVNGARLFRLPYNGKALRVERFFHHEFGGFPELDYEQEARHSDVWRVGLAHERERIERNDSTIFSYVDHGVVALEGTELDKLTKIHARQGQPVRFENFVSYLTTSWAEVTWTHGGTTVSHENDYHGRLVTGQPLQLTTTGSAEVEPAGVTFSALVTSTLTGVENGATLSLEVNDPPVLDASAPLALTFDRPLDAEHAYIVLAPWTVGDNGARQAFIQPKEATDRIVIPAGVLQDLIAGAAADRVPYLLGIEEYRFEDDVFSGVFADGSHFSLPFFQESETSLLVYLER